jgi:hypothetical protein
MSMYDVCMSCVVSLPCVVPYRVSCRVLGNWQPWCLALALVLFWGWMCFSFLEFSLTCFLRGKAESVIVIVIETSIMFANS